jgi:1,2-phenylacetyl-CoA epoxidase PaaB subunit
VGDVEDAAELEHVLSRQARPLRSRRPEAVSVWASSSIVTSPLTRT